MYWFNIKKNNLHHIYLFLFCLFFFQVFFNQTLCTLWHVGELTMLCCVNRARVLFLIFFFWQFDWKKNLQIKTWNKCDRHYELFFYVKTICRYEKNVLSVHIEPLYRPTAKCVTYVEIKHMHQAWLFSTC